jgi:predicted CoA-binding protein
MRVGYPVTIGSTRRRRFVARWDQRTRRSWKMPSRSVIDRFLAEKRIAFVGASRDSKQFANSVYREFRDHGYDVVPVHITAHEIEGDVAYATLADVPDPIDAVFVILPRERLEGVVDQCIARGVHHVWIHRGCVVDESVAALREHGIEVVDGACPLMFLEPVRNIHRVHRFFAKRSLAA